MESILFALPGNEKITAELAQRLKAETGETTIRQFPDGETYVRIHSKVKDKCVVLVATLHKPDEKLLALYFLSQTAQSLGARCTCLVAPYIPYMRQDKVFNPGEGVTSEFFGKLLSRFVDSLITVDPHLHRKESLTEVFNIPTEVVHSATYISKWIKGNIENPLLVGPDSESEQWVSKVAADAGAPYIVLQKTRHGDHHVDVSIPQVNTYRNHTPVIVDDIISTARTMIETVARLKMAGMKAPTCIGIHAIFAESAFEDLKKAGAEVITCNTIPHKSNQIDLSDLLAEKLLVRIQQV